MLGKTSTAQEGSRDYTVTLALEPQQATLLLYAREQGKLQLSLRSRHEKSSQVAIAPANVRTLMQAVLGPQAVAEEPKPQRSVEVYKGLERTMVAVNE